MLEFLAGADLDVPAPIYPDGPTVVVAGSETLIQSQNAATYYTTRVRPSQLRRNYIGSCPNLFLTPEENRSLGRPSCRVASRLSS